MTTLFFMPPPFLLGVDGEEEDDGVIVLLVYTVYLFPFQDISILGGRSLGCHSECPICVQNPGNWKKAQMEVLWKSGMKAVRNDCVPGDWAIKSLQLPGDSGHGTALRYGWTDRSLGAGRWSIPGNTWFIIMRSTGNGD